MRPARQPLTHFFPSLTLLFQSRRLRPRHRFFFNFFCIQVLKLRDWRREILLSFQFRSIKWWKRPSVFPLICQEGPTAEAQTIYPLLVDLIFKEASKSNFFFFWRPSKSICSWIKSQNRPKKPQTDNKRKCTITVTIYQRIHHFTLTLQGWKKGFTLTDPLSRTIPEHLERMETLIHHKAGECRKTDEGRGHRDSIN